MVFWYEVEAVKDYATSIYGAHFIQKEDLLFIKTDKDFFKVNLKDKERFGNYTLFHKNKIQENGYHMQGKFKDLHYLIFIAASHDVYKEADINFEKEDWFSFRKDALKYYFRGDD